MRRNADRHVVIWHVANHDSACANNTVFANFDALDDRRTDTDVGSLTNRNLAGKLCADRDVAAAADDRIVLDKADSFVDGGTGVDTLVASSSIDFVHDSLPKFDGIEVVDASNNTSMDTLTFDLNSVRNMSSSSEQLWVKLDSTDQVRLEDFTKWTTQSLTSTDTIYSQDGVRLRISGLATANVINATPTGSGTTYNGGTGNDTLSGNKGSDYVDGGAGDDTITTSGVTAASTITAQRLPDKSEA